MSEFKVGVRVKEISTGDIGVIDHITDGWCWVKWETMSSKKDPIYRHKEDLIILMEQSVMFTKEQLSYLEKRYGLTVEEESLEKDEYKVRDGVVKYGDKLYWRGDKGAEEFQGLGWEKHLEDIKSLPEYYSINKPKYREVVYYDE